MFALFIISVFKQQLQYPQSVDGNPTSGIVYSSKLIACTIAKLLFFLIGDSKKWSLQVVLSKQQQKTVCMLCFSRKATYMAGFPPVCLCHHQRSIQVAVKTFSRFQHVENKNRSQRLKRGFSLVDFTNSGLRVYGLLKKADS